MSTIQSIRDYLNDIGKITNQIVSDNCFSHETIDVIEGITKINTILNELNDNLSSGLFKGDKGDKGDTPNVQVGVTETLEPGSKASVTQTGDILNPVLNFAIPKGDTGKSTESIQDSITSLDTTWSSSKIDSCFNDLKNIQGVKYGNDVGYQVCKGTHNGVIKDLKVYGKTKLVNAEGIEVEPGTDGATLISVGNGNEIEVSTRKEDGNLFNISDFKRYIHGLGSEYSSYLVRDSRNCWYPTNYSVFHSKFMWDIRLDENVSYVIKFDYYFESANQNKGLYFRVYYTDGSFEYPVWGEQNKWSTAKITTNPNKSIAYIHMTYGESTNKTWIDLDSIVIAKAKNYNDKLENKQDKKTILFKDTDNSWKSVTELNEWDVLDTTVSKLIIGTEKVSFSTNSNWRENQSPSTTHKTYWRKYEGYKLNNVICDKLPTYNVATFDKKCIFTVNNEYLYFTIPISECSDISKLGEWFVANPMNILIPTPIKKEYEINPIYLDSYENETMILFNTGSIPCKNEFYIDSNLGSLQLETLDRLGRIEDYIYQSNVAILRGDFRTLAELYYPNDFIKKEEFPNE